jgi:hypothetical protein
LFSHLANRLLGARLPRLLPHILQALEQLLHQRYGLAPLELPPELNRDCMKALGIHHRPV